MKVKLIIAGVCLAFVSCNEIKEEDNIPTSKVELLTSLENTEDTVKDNAQEEAAPKNAADNKVLLIARGTEPGWYAEFSNTHLRLLLDNGTDSVHLDYNFDKISTEKTYKAAIVEKSNKANIAIGITLENKECTEGGSGEKRDRSITIKYKNTLYKGCAYLNK
ncbi:MAG: hypothetical protein K0S12_2198 [Bacteroidetes bacterium]|jgi:uncharacterized membrane protein|nr:hypothetical protein [Bacteroidota bacterium]